LPLSRDVPYFRMRRQLDAPIAHAPLPTGVALRPFDIDTARECRDLMNRVYGEGFGDPVAFDVWWPWLTSDADYAAELMFVAVADGKVVGFCHCWTGAFIKDIVVDRPSRGRGIAGALITMALVASTERAAPFVDLKTDVDNVKAQSLYRKLGFEIVERVG
jgi:ribosomal protein S18 acetylase RimI-like enzyme